MHRGDFGRLRPPSLQAGGIAAGAPIDWPWIYGRLARAFGWSLDYIDDLGMDRAWEMLEYLFEHPLPEEILAAVHLKQDKKKKIGKQALPKTKEEGLAQAVQCANMLGLEAAPLPAHLRDMAMWALDMQKKLQGKPN